MYSTIQTQINAVLLCWQTIQRLVIDNNEMDNQLAELEGQYRKQAAKFEELNKRLSELTEELAENRWHC